METELTSGELTSGPLVHNFNMARQQNCITQKHNNQPDLTFTDAAAAFSRSLTYLFLSQSPLMDILPQRRLLFKPQSHFFYQ